MSVTPNLIVRAFAPRIASKAMQTFDRATLIVVGICWAAAVVMMVFAAYAASSSSKAKEAVESALAAEPSLPTVSRSAMDVRAAQAIVDRLQRRYPDIGFALQGGQGVIVTATEGSKFRQWLTALSYIDTISPEYQWSIQQFCVGRCSGELMRAIVKGEKISFEVPKPKS